MSNDLIPSQQEMQTLETLSKYAMQSKFFDKIGSQGGLLSIMIYAKELGLPPMQCLFGGMHNINGKIELSAALMNSMIRRGGHKLEILLLDNKACTLKGTRKDNGETYTETFTMNDAETACLMSNPTWKKYPKNMLFARALKNLARVLFSDIIGPSYVEGEVSELDEEKPHKKLPEIQAEEEPDAPIVEATVEEAVVEQEPIIVEDFHVEAIQKVSGIEDREKLKLYMTRCATQFKKTPEELLQKWTLDPAHLQKNFVKWLEKQAADNSKL
jgi:hypothetical protein